MDNNYNIIYQKFEKNFQEEAKSYIPDNKIKNILDMEKLRLNNAEKYNIPYNRITGGSLARYTKDVLRQNQPLFFIYYILGMAAGFSYCLLIWSVVKCTILYLAGFKDAFSTHLPYSVSIVFFAVIIICSSVTQLYTRKLLSAGSTMNNGRKGTRTKISVFNAVCYSISAIIITAAALFIYLSPENAPSAKLSLSGIFIMVVALLSLSGIHNVIYSSHIVTFLTAGYAAMMHNPQERDNAISHYIGLSLSAFLATRHIEMADYNKNTSMHNDFNYFLRRKVITFRVYGALAFFITFILAALCIRQLITTGWSSELVIFTVFALVITVIMLLEIISCNYILKTCKASIKI